MRGRTLRVSTFYRPPVTYLERTVNKTINGIEEEVFLADNGKLYPSPKCKIDILILLIDIMYYSLRFILINS